MKTYPIKEQYQEIIRKAKPQRLQEMLEYWTTNYHPNGQWIIDMLNDEIEMRTIESQISCAR